MQPPLKRPAIISDYLVTAEIVYRLPDFPALLQTFIWQDYDLPPDYPALRRFLDFWRRELEGKLHSVRVMAAPTPLLSGLRHAACVLTIH